MVFIKHNSLKSNKHFNPTFIPCFLGPTLLRVQFFQSPGFSASRFFRVCVQGPGPGFRSSPKVMKELASNFLICQQFNCKHVLCQQLRHSSFSLSTPELFLLLKLNRFIMQYVLVKSFHFFCISGLLTFFFLQWS